MDLNAADVDATTGRLLEICDEPGASLRETSLRRWQQDGQRRQGCELNRARAHRLLQELRACRQQLQEMSGPVARDAEALSATEIDLLEAVEEQIDRAACEQGDDEEINAVAPSSAVDAEEIVFESVSAEAPETASELLGRLGVTMPPVGQDDEEAAAETSRSRQSSRPAAEAAGARGGNSAAEASSTDGPGQESDASIDDYMARLLERVGKKSRREEVIYQPDSPAQVASKVSEVAAETVGEEKPEILTELPVRANRPVERPVDMSAMRELAHLHTTSLLDLHFRKSFKRSTTGQGVVAACALLTGIVSAALCGEVPIAFYLSILGFAVAIVCGWHSIAAVWHLAFGGLAKKSQGADNKLATIEPSAPAAHATNPAVDIPETEPAAAQIESATGDNESAS